MLPCGVVSGRILFRMAGKDKEDDRPPVFLLDDRIARDALGGSNGSAPHLRYTPPGVAALFSSSFFLLSVGFSYVFWLQPEVFNMFSVAACLFFGLPRTDESGLPDRRREIVFAALSGAALVLAVYNKPMFAAV